ncbi:amino acid adenylation [Neptunicella marina]|uniref:Amino acid adenylation n=1 Tax=Neptunicella marina TaxID=2125989 RepID=A0A8J6LZS7_9ALTE|nr:amino acid adenylation [Neptunicella marina]MBC3766385.1 amino acid adenylation [Neptunicella marina]
MRGNTPQLIFSATNALNKWLKADLPRLPVEPGKQAGVNTLSSGSDCLCWQVHIIDNRYQSYEKTIIACEANSRFTFFLPVEQRLSLQELTQILQMEWQAVLADTLEAYQIIPRSEIALLLSDLSELEFNPEWVRNTDLSINGHISDAGLWVTDTLSDRKLSQLTPELAAELAAYLNTQTRRIKQRKVKFVPLERLLGYCRDLSGKVREEEALHSAKIIKLSDYRRT